MQKLLGKFESKSLEIINTDRHYVPPAELLVQIEAYWNAAVEKHGSKLWNGVNYRLEQIVEENGLVTLHLGTADYKVNFASRHLAKEIRALSWEQQPRCMYVSTLMETTDGKYILGETASSGVHGRMRALVGGILNQDEQVINSGSDLEAYLYKELEEEFGISKEMIVESNGVGIYEMDTCRVGVFMHTRLKLSQKEFEKLAQVNDEHDGYAVMTTEQIWVVAKEADTDVNTGVVLVLRELSIPLQLENDY
ncbi:MAG: hypothetical protein KatS3mg087_1463 [Patescibacteria group bacterium]|nr:MAG: hypothetical protein KatS3mg087_1463 [Patescibacteria group bacterium]